MLYPNQPKRPGLQKSASAYPPGYKGAAQVTAKPAVQPQQIPNNGKIMQPGGGFGIQTSAAETTNDSYTQYQQANTTDQIWQSLQTEAGRVAVGAQMA